MEAAVLSNLLVSFILLLESEWPLLRSLFPLLTERAKGMFLFKETMKFSDAGANPVICVASMGLEGKPQLSEE